MGLLYGELDVAPITLWSMTRGIVALFAIFGMDGGASRYEYIGRPGKFDWTRSA